MLRRIIRLVPSKRVSIELVREFNFHRRWNLLARTRIGFASSASSTNWSASSSTGISMDDEDGEDELIDDEPKPQTSRSTPPGFKPSNELDYFYSIAFERTTLGEEHSTTEIVDDSFAPIEDAVRRVKIALESNHVHLPNALADVVDRIDQYWDGSWGQLLRLAPILNQLPNRWTAPGDFGRIASDLSQLINVIDRKLNGDDLLDLATDQLIDLLTMFARISSSAASKHGAIARLLEALGRRCADLSRDDFVRLLFFIGVHRSMPKSISVRFENELIKLFDGLTDRQTTLAGFAFYRTDSPFESRRLLTLMINRASTSSPSPRSIDRDSDFQLAMVAKLLKLNGRYEHSAAMPSFARRLLDRPLDADSFYFYTHFASACRRMNFYDETLGERMLEKMLADLDRLRIKDVVLIFNYLLVMNHPVSTAITDRLIDYFRRSFDSETSNMPPRALYTLSLRDIYPIDLVSQVLGDEYLIGFKERRVSMGHLPLRALYWLDCSIAIERPDYDGNRLNLSLLERADIAQMAENSQPMRFPTSVDVVFKSQMDIAAEMARRALGCDRCSIRYGLILPHSPMPSLVIKLNGDGSVGSPEEVRTSQNVDREALEVPKDETWIAMLIQTPGNCRNQTTHFLGHHAAHQRQLEKLGYKILLVNHKSLPKRPHETGVKRFEQFFRYLRNGTDERVFVY